jgi:coenzyme PQQ precursor peptide PqqA
VKNLIHAVLTSFLRHKPVKVLAAQHKQCGFRTKDLTGELFDPQYLKSMGGISSGRKKESQMAWKAPKIVEVPVGMEIHKDKCGPRK